MRRCVRFEQPFYDFIDFRQNELRVVFNFVARESNHLDTLLI